MNKKGIEINDLPLIVAAAAMVLRDCDMQEDLAERFNVPIADVVALVDRVHETRVTGGSRILIGCMKDWMKREDPDNCGPENGQEYNLVIDLESVDQFAIKMSPAGKRDSCFVASMDIEVNRGFPALHTQYVEDSDHSLHAHWTRDGIYLSPDNTMVEFTHECDPLYKDDRSMLIHDRDIPLDAVDG